MILCVLSFSFVFIEFVENRSFDDQTSLRERCCPWLRVSPHQQVAANKHFCSKVLLFEHVYLIASPKPNGVLPVFLAVLFSFAIDGFMAEQNLCPYVQ